MGTSIQIFENANFGQIRTSLTESGEPLFCLADVCKALDINGGARNVKSRLSQKGVVSINTPTNGGVQQLNFITEPNLYKCIFQSRKKEAEQFQDWVCGEVLPSIRTNGGYIATRKEDTPEEIMARALIVAQKTIEQSKQRIQMLEGENENLSEENRALAPRAAYTDKVLQSVSTYTFTQMAKELGFTSVNTFVKTLRDRRMIFRQSNQWQLMAKYAGHGYTTTRTAHYFRSDGTPECSVSTVWTERGRAFLHTFFDEKGGEK